MRHGNSDKLHYRNSKYLLYVYLRNGSHFPLPGAWEVGLLPTSRDLGRWVKSHFPGSGAMGQIPLPGKWEVGLLPKAWEVGSVVIYSIFNFPKFGK